MKFGAVPVSEAEGGLLAHALKLPDRRYKKGHLLSGADIEAIASFGVETLIIARLDEGDVEENEAARQLAAALESEHVTAARAFTGRVNFHAQSPGVFLADRQAIDAINAVDPAITVATLADDSFVEAGRMVATVKIIPLAVNEKTLARAVALADADTAMTLHPSRSRSIGLVQTTLPDTIKPSVLDKTRRVLEARLKPSGNDVLVGEHRVAHENEALANVLRVMVAECDLIIVFGASAIIDADDVIPSAIRAAGGDVATLGMPVDPGNLLLTGQIGATQIIGAPGCARSPAENGFDWVLQRLLSDLPVGIDYVSRLGVGGLLMEIHERPQPREPQ
ncbi:MAG: molybdopterin-binding protein [Ahrensia sp.]|nr:molybdopterin-binding protein [Ahrensia sp.]